MNLINLILQFILTIPLTIILEFLKDKKNKNLNSIIIPTIYIILVAAILPSLKQNCFLIVIFEIFMRNFYITNLTSQRNDQRTNIINMILSIILSLFTYNYFISKVENVIPSPESIKPFLWFIILSYLVYIYINNNNNKKEQEEKKIARHNKEHIVMQYAKFKNKYNNYVISNNLLINNLLYAIMIYEDNTHPAIYRHIKEYIARITKKQTKYGLMQVPSYTYLKDEETITIKLHSFEDKIIKVKKTEQLDVLLDEYDDNAKETIITIYNDILEFQKK